MSAAQPEIYTILYLIQGKQSPSPIKLASNEIVGTLRKEIKAEQPLLSHIAADELCLYRVDILDDDDLLTNVEKWSQQHSKPLRATAKLSTVFDSTPKADTIHIIVQLPETNRLKRKRSSSLKEKFAQRRRKIWTDGRLDTEPPSSASVKSYKIPPKMLCSHRPPESEVIPITLLTPIFAEFCDDADTLQPTEADYKLMEALRDAISKYWEKESDLCDQFRRTVSATYQDVHFSAAHVGATKSSTDGHIQEGMNMCAVMEGKLWNESGNPEIQAVLYVRLTAKSQHVTHGQEDQLDLLPCIIICLVESYVCFLGTVLTDRYHLENLTGYLPLHTNPHDDRFGTQIARAFGASRIALDKIRKHYRQLVQQPQSRQPPGYPYADRYTQEDGKEVTFTYESRLYDSRLIFIAKTEEGQKIFIKFVQRYSADAHRYCAQQKVAPQLLACRALPGGWSMVVMEYLDPLVYRRLMGSDVEDKASVKEVRRVVDILHGGDFVHGDIRKVNIMRRRIWEDDGVANVLLVDFDWAGRDGEVNYPGNLNPAVFRHEGAKRRQPIMKEHDIYMLDMLYNQQSPVMF